MIKWTEDHISQKGMIITDDVTYEPILDFGPYSDTIVNIIKDSYPKFIGHLWRMGNLENDFESSRKKAPLILWNTSLGTTRGISHHCVRKFQVTS
jgi:hypothetical protein